MSTNVVSGGFPHLYNHSVSGATVDASSVRSVARADVAELHAALEPAIEIDDDVHIINVATKRALTATEFKQMFYARGDDEFSIANVYECPNVGSNILASVWGKRIVNSSANTNVQGNDGVDNLLTFGAGLPSLSPPPGFIIGSRIKFLQLMSGTIIPEIILGQMYYVTTIYNYNLPTIVFTISETFGGPTMSLTVGGGAATPIYNIQYGNMDIPYNTSRIMNYNKLSSRPDDPSGVDLAYGYANDLQRNFYASHEVMGNLEKDLCIKKDNWTLCSRIAIEDQLHNLAFAPEETDDVCMKVSCARKWSEVEDALAESCLAENNIIGLGDYVDLFINVRVTNGNKDTTDTIIRIRFTVQMTRGPDDLGNWNVVSRNAASAMLTTGIPRDAVEGGNLQYANASLTEIAPNSNPSYVQPPNTTSPPNLDTALDPHDFNNAELVAKWTKLGSDIDGDTTGDDSGWAVSLNNDGTIVAIGAPLSSSSTGHVRVFGYTSGGWSQLGSDIDGQVSNGQHGMSVSLNGDGTILAIGAPFATVNAVAFAGHVRVFGYTSGNWTQLGINIDGGTGINQIFGWSVSLDSGGTKLAIGVPDLITGNGPGSVQLYEYTSSSWSQLGSDIDGDTVGDWFGTSVSLSADGTIVAIGAPLSSSFAGHVQVFGYTSGGWSQLGSDIDGDTTGDKSGWSVSLDSGGTKLAIGAPYNNGNGFSSGHVRVFEWNSGGSSWGQLGSDIDGEADSDTFGWSVSLSADGTTVAAGGPQNGGDGAAIIRGHVRVFEWNSGGSSWDQLGSDIDGNTAGDRSGRSVSLNNDGTTVAAGAPFATYVQVYKYQ